MTPAFKTHNWVSDLFREAWDYKTQQTIKGFKRSKVLRDTLLREKTADRLLLVLYANGGRAWAFTLTAVMRLANLDYPDVRSVFRSRKRARQVEYKRGLNERSGVYTLTPWGKQCAGRLGERIAATFVMCHKPYKATSAHARPTLPKP